MTECPFHAEPSVSSACCMARDFLQSQPYDLVRYEHGSVSSNCGMAQHPRSTVQLSQGKLVHRSGTPYGSWYSPADAKVKYESGSRMLQSEHSPALLAQFGYMSPWLGSRTAPSCRFRALFNMHHSSTTDEGTRPDWQLKSRMVLRRSTSGIQSRERARQRACRIPLVVAVHDLGNVLARITA